MKKILFVDSWTKGINHFYSISKAFKAAEIEFILYHWGILNRDNSYNDIDAKGSIKIKSFTTYSSKKFGKVLETEKPDLMLKLTFSFPFDIAQFKLAKLKNIKTVFFAHGTEYFSGIFEVPENIKYIYLDLLKIKKWSFLFKTTYEGEKAWAKAKGLKNNFYKEFYNSVLFKHKYWYNRVFTESELPDYCIVYSRLDANKMIKCGFKEEQIRIIGFPLLDNTFLIKNNTDEFNSIQNYFKEFNHENTILYFSTGLIEAGLISIEDYQLYIKKLVESVKKCGRNIILKVHPVENIKNYSAFEDESVKIIQNEIDTYKLLGWSERIIGEFSTLIPISYYVGKNVKYLDLLDIKIDKFNNFAKERGIYIDDWNQLEDFLKDDSEHENRFSEKEIFDYLGYNDGNSGGRIEKALKEIIEGSGI